MILGSLFIDFQMLYGLLAFLECISFEIEVIFPADGVNVRMGGESAINEVVNDVGALFEFHGESFGNQESELILFDNELIANVVIGNFFGTQIPVVVSVEILFERLEVFLD